MSTCAYPDGCTTTVTTQPSALPNTGAQHASVGFELGFAAIMLGAVLLVLVARFPLPRPYRRKP